MTKLITTKTVLTRVMLLLTVLFVAALGLLWSVYCAAPVSASAMPSESSRRSSDKRLIVWFSLYGNSMAKPAVDAGSSASVFIRAGKREGTTELLAKIIQKETGGSVLAIHTQKKYPAVFEEVIEQNHKELAEDFMPALLAQDMTDLSRYETIFIGYPVWANTIPRPVAAFIKAHNFKGKTIIPFCTHDGYSSGRSYAAIGSLAAGATVLDGLAVEARDVPDSAGKVKAWLASLDISGDKAAVPRKNERGIPITITVGGRTLEGIMDETPLAQEITAKMPFSVSMVNYGERELYGSLSEEPKNQPEGSLYFENGDITYAPANNSVALFYAKARKDKPPLTMKVIRIGKITSDLAVFGSFGNSETVNFALKKGER